ncbi:TspO/MBR family protein [Sphingomonas sp.]|jgi:tryptophan-rich sensory protein|uniref:TspO/MBR family protein n=1 Tax=Sphingomonas sp. TaxID=28214 RepID=UPI002D7EE410|nr:TspO/MBR family protein [Sphingomonas sp.]HEU0045662.1 TspO/MBR family protein [Sphingomonas sp.]
MSRAWVAPVAVAAFMAAIVAVLGATVTEIGPWYHGLAKPAWTPAPAAFGVAWTAIYALTGLAGVTAWLATPRWDEREWLLGLFALSGFLNIVWSLLFFQLQRPDWALIEVVGLWLSVAGLIVLIWRRSMIGAALLVPYLLWVTFAGYLNMAVVRLNGPFS